MKTPSPFAIERAMSIAMSTQAEDTAVPQDADVWALLDRLAESAIADKLLAEMAHERSKRLEARCDAARDTIGRMLEALGLERLERASYDAALVASPPAVVITDANKVPSDLFNQPTPSKVKIGKMLAAGSAVPGAELRNTHPVLRLTTR